MARSRRAASWSTGAPTSTRPGWCVRAGHRRHMFSGKAKTCSRWSRVERTPRQRDVNPRIPLDLEEIILKAIAFHATTATRPAAICRTRSAASSSSWPAARASCSTPARWPSFGQRAAATIGARRSARPRARAAWGGPRGARHRCAAAAKLCAGRCSAGPAESSMPPDPGVGSQPHARPPRRRCRPWRRCRPPSRTARRASASTCWCSAATSAARRRWRPPGPRERCACSSSSSRWRATSHSSTRPRPPPRRVGLTCVVGLPLASEEDSSRDPAGPGPIDALDGIGSTSSRSCAWPSACSARGLIRRSAEARSAVRARRPPPPAWRAACRRAQGGDILCAAAVPAWPGRLELRGAGHHRSAAGPGERDRRGPLQTARRVYRVRGPKERVHEACASAAPQAASCRPRAELKALRDRTRRARHRGHRPS